MSLSLSIIIPTLNESEALPATIKALRLLTGEAEIIVADGGSVDGTKEIAKALEVRFIDAQNGRGNQMNAGAAAASGDILWFLHADTIPENNSIEWMSRELDDPDAIGGNFTIRFDGNSRPARFMTWLYPKLRRIGLTYGDSAIFVRRVTFEKIGGFKPIPLFEDLDFVRRLRIHGDFRNSDAVVVTSSRRFEDRSFLLMFSRWSSLQVLYWLGFSPNYLATFYHPIRGPK